MKQEMLVQYLQDAYSFSQKITEAIGIISKMMYENTTTGRPVLIRSQSCLLTFVGAVVIIIIRLDLVLCG